MLLFFYFHDTPNQKKKSPAVPAVGNFTDEQEQRGALLPQDTREYPLQSNEYHHNNKNGGKMPTTNLNGERNYNNGPQCKYLTSPLPLPHPLTSRRTFSFFRLVVMALAATA